MEAGMSPCGLVKKLVSPGPRLINSESTLSRPESCCGEKGPCRWNVGVGLNWQGHRRPEKENCGQRGTEWGEAPGEKRGGVSEGGREDP